MMLRVASFAVCLVLAFSYNAKNVNFMEIGMQAYQPSKPGQFVYEACNTTNAAIFIKTLKVTPSGPIEYGEQVKVTAEVDLAKEIDGKTIDYNMEILLCVPDAGCHNMCDLIPGTCTGTDVCALLTKLPYECPAIVTKQGSNCECPFKKKTYQFKNIPLTVPSPPQKIAGNFTITMKLKQGSTELSCSRFRFCLENCG